MNVNEHTKWLLVSVGWSDHDEIVARQVETKARSSLPCLTCVGWVVSFRSVT